MLVCNIASIHHLHTPLELPGQKPRMDRSTEGNSFFGVHRQGWQDAGGGLHQLQHRRHPGGGPSQDHIGDLPWRRRILVWHSIDEIPLAAAPEKLGRVLE
mmetsp:Transcript_23953/g.66536  ORF Transcript_23953/g.66536 Transcript_23953/m.66536 type:complete len:100 (+) Transcript_23953:581-880(+)